VRHSQFTLGITVLLLIAVVASTTLSAVKAAPTSATQTLMTRLTPESATIGQTIAWLIWTDPSLPGQQVTLTITDIGNTTSFNNTIIYNHNVNFNTTTYQLSVNTAAFKHHVYAFTANTTSGNMKLKSTRYNDFSSAASGLIMYALASPFYSIPGETVKLTIYAYDSATFHGAASTANITLSNSTKPSLQSWTNVAIPASNGSRVLQVSTTGLKSGSYQFNVNATSAIGKAASTAYFVLQDIIITVQNSTYYIGNPVNVSIRTYPSITQSGLEISFFNYTSFKLVKVVNQYVTLTNGKAIVLPNSSTWKPESYDAIANATVNSNNVEALDYFNLEAFSVDVETDKGAYLPGQSVNATTTTTPNQGVKQFRLKVTNSTDDVIWTYGPSNLRSDGTAVNLISTTGWRVGRYTVEASVTSTVQGTQYVINSTSDFNIYSRTFNIDAKLSSYTFSGYVMPLLNITTSPGQTNANLTITIQGPDYYIATQGVEYLFKKTLFDSTQYLYNLPLPIAPNGTRIIRVQVDSSAGTNLTQSILSYTHTNEVVVSEPFLLQTALLIGLSPLFYVAIKKRKEPALSEG
jgi:hypothetical protein